MILMVMVRMVFPMLPHDRTLVALVVPLVHDVNGCISSAIYSKSKEGVTIRSTKTVLVNRLRAGNK